MAREAVEYLSLRPGGTYVDATVGGGGHSERIARALKGRGDLICVDRDEDAIERARLRLRGLRNVRFVRGNFADIRRILKDLNVRDIKGILLDLGVSSHQIDTGARGFSLREDGPLDMRMDASQTLSAADVVNSFEAGDLARIIRDFGEERFAKKIAAAIASRRRSERITTTGGLAGVIGDAVRFLPPKKRRDCVMRTFQAIRIAVNNELDNLRKALRDSVDLLGRDGRIVVICYHSLEDRIVKTAFRLEASPCVCPPRAPKCTCGKTARLRVLTKRPVGPDAAEISKNPRARSAKLRAAERISDR